MRVISFAFALLIAFLAIAGQALAEPAHADRYMVSAANPHASEAGLRILREGGSAADAAIAVQLVLSLVEPQSSGIGSGAFLIHYEAASGQLRGYDGRETAPMAADETLFLDEDGDPIPFFNAFIGGRSVGTPGIFRLFELVHREHGRLAWADLFEPAIELAEHGFEVSTRFHALVDGSRGLRTQAAALQYFYTDEGEALPVGYVRTNQPYADVLRRVAGEGADAFYFGAIAEDIVAAVTSHASPGLLSLEDMAAYRAIEREPICGPYRSYRICGMPPPTSGGTTVLAILGMLEHFDLASADPGTALAVHLISEASRLAYADRALYLGDSDFVDVPVAALIDGPYLATRAGLIDPVGTAWPGGAMPPAGDLLSGAGQRFGPGAGPDVPSTSHWSIVDGDGNAVAITSSVQAAFGSAILVHGFLLNNQLTDFSFRADYQGLPAANRPQGGKRPLSSMSPTIVFDSEGRPFLLVGSPGGQSIIGFVARTIIAVIDWNLDVQAAIDLGHHLSRGTNITLEEGTAVAELENALESLGHEVDVRSINSGLHAIRFHWRADGYRLTGGADPRREGVALGD